MPVTDQTVHLSRQAREALDKIVDQTTRDLVIAWANAWDEVSQAWLDAVNDLIAYQQQNGAWPPAWRIARAERAQSALQTTGEALAAVSAAAGVRIAQTLTGLTADAADWEARLIASQMPPKAVAGRMAVGATFNRVDPDALEAIVKRTTEQVTATTLPLSGEATAVMNRELVRGIAVGDNPRTAAARMLQRVEGGFNGGLARAMTIARTEMLDAHREAARAQRVANADTLTGWQWLATLDTRTCPSCLAQNGSTHPVDEQGPDDHQNGRCTAVPASKSWRDLGFDLNDPPSVMPDAQAWFNELPEADQLAVMGPQRLEMLRDGKIDWTDLSTRKTTPGWRDSHHVTSVRDLQTRATNRVARPAPAKPTETGRGTVRGKVTVPAAHGFKLEQHEYATAQRLAAGGHDVEFLVPSREVGVKNPDVLIDGEVWEMKAPQGMGRNTIDHQMKRAAKQANRLVLDTTRTGLDDDAIISVVTRRLATYDGLSEVIVIRKDGTLVHLHAPK